MPIRDRDMRLVRLVAVNTTLMVDVEREGDEGPATRRLSCAPPVYSRWATNWESIFACGQADQPLRETEAMYERMDWQTGLQKAVCTGHASCGVCSAGDAF
jgi:hypothetical protein